MQTLLQSLNWNPPTPYPWSPVLSTTAQAQILSAQAFNTQLLTGSWMAIGQNLIWFSWDNGGTRQPYATTSFANGWAAGLQTALYNSYVSYMKAYIRQPGQPMPRTLAGADNPPANIANLGGTTWPDPFTECSEADAMAIFLDAAGHALAVEQLGLLPWTIASESAGVLADLFDMTRTFSTPDVTNQYRLSSAVPCKMYTAMTFVLANGILCGTRLESIGQLLRWCKILKHKEFPPDNNPIYNDGFQWAQDFFGYRGAPPVAEMLAGTVYQGSDASAKALYGTQSLHWTTGCHATCVLIQNILRAINIPAFRIDDDLTPWTALAGPNGTIGGAHASLLFRNVNRALPHGDNPYDVMIQNPGLLPFPGEAMTVQASSFLPAAFVPNSLYTDIIDLPVLTVAAQYLTKGAVLAQYAARMAGAPAGSVTPTFTEGGAQAGTTLGSWEAAALGAGTRLDALVEPYLSDPDMTRLQNDLNAIPSYESVAPAS